MNSLFAQHDVWCTFDRSIGHSTLDGPFQTIYLAYDSSLLVCCLLIRDLAAYLLCMDAELPQKSHLVKA